MNQIFVYVHNNSRKTTVAGQQLQIMTTKQPLNVAIIGAGISGVVTAAHLSRRGVNVTIFERAAEAGGVWYAVYDLKDNGLLINPKGIRRKSTARTVIPRDLAIQRRAVSRRSRTD